MATRPQGTDFGVDVELLGLVVVVTGDGFGLVVVVELDEVVVGATVVVVTGTVVVVAGSVVVVTGAAVVEVSATRDAPADPAAPAGAGARATHKRAITQAARATNADRVAVEAEGERRVVCLVAGELGIVVTF
jgi:hypothetical protein